MILFTLLAMQVAVSGIADDAEGCTDKEGPRALSACYSDHATQWELRMEKAYANAFKSPNGYDRAALARSQTQWIKYRHSECDFYAKQKGTMGYIQSSYCHLDLNRRRALELEAIPLP